MALLWQTEYFSHLASFAYLENRTWDHLPKAPAHCERSDLAQCATRMWAAAVASGVEAEASASPNDFAQEVSTCRGDMYTSDRTADVMRPAGSQPRKY